MPLQVGTGSLGGIVFFSGETLYPSSNYRSYTATYAILDLETHFVFDLPQGCIARHAFSI